MTRNYRLEQAFRTGRTGCDRLRPATTRQSLCSTRVVGLVSDQATEPSCLIATKSSRQSRAQRVTTGSHAPSLSVPAAGRAACACWRWAMTMPARQPGARPPRFNTFSPTISVPCAADARRGGGLPALRSW
jgi:hypothetical protein